MIENLDLKIKALTAAAMCIETVSEFDENVNGNPNPAIALINDLQYDLLDIKEQQEGLEIEYE
jgi:hypothetical protein